MTEVANWQTACESSLFGLSPREDTQLFPYGYPLVFSKYPFFLLQFPFFFFFLVFNLFARITRTCEYNKVYFRVRSRAHSTSF